jgi:hypothetical protein
VVIPAVAICWRLWGVKPIFCCLLSWERDKWNNEYYIEKEQFQYMLCKIKEIVGRWGWDR